MSPNQDRPHEPDPAFVEALEWQLRRELRRSARFGAPVTTTAEPGRSKGRFTMMTTIAAIILASVTLGAAGTYGLVRVDEQAQRELRVRLAQIRLEHAELRLAEETAARAEVEPLVEQGFVGQAERDAIVLRVQSAEAEVKRRRLDLEETRLTGRPADDHLAAPPVEGRDFVSERLELMLATAELDVARRASVLDQVAKLAERGFVTTRELRHEEMSLADTQRKLERVRARLELRRRFRAGELDASRVELLDMRAELESEAEQAVRHIEVARLEHDRTQLLHDRGRVSPTEVREARATLREAELRLSLARTRLELVLEQIGSSSEDGTP